MPISVGYSGGTAFRKRSRNATEEAYVPAYAIVAYDVVDPKGFEPYVPAVLPILQKHGAEIVVGDFAAEALEGEARGVHVILKFPSEEAIRNFHADPEYVPVKQIRLDSTANGSFVLAKAFVMPAK